MRRAIAALSFGLLGFSTASARQPVNALWASNFSAGAGIRSVTKIHPAGSVVVDTPLGPFTPFGLAVDPFGNVWAGSNGTTVAKLDSAGNLINTYAVGSFPQSVASDAAGSVWVVNRTSNSVMRLDNAGNVTATTPLPAGTSPIGVVVDGGGVVWVSGFHASTSTSHSLFQLDAAGTIVNTFPFVSASPGFGFSFPSVDSNDDVWVSNQARMSILQVDGAGNILTETPISSGLPRGNQVDGLDFVWLASQGFAGSCVKIDQSGTIVRTFLPPSTSFTTCAIDGYGDPWVFGFSTGMAIKLWQVDATPLVTVTLPSGHSAYGGDAGAFHLAANLNRTADFDGDTFSNAAEVSAGTNPLDVASTPIRPLPIQSGVPTLGATVKIGFRLRADAGRAYIAALALGSAPGILLPDGRVIPLNPDPLLFLTLGSPLPGFGGILNATGDALGDIPIPNDGTLVGLPFVCAFVTLDPAASFGIQTISNPLSMTIL